MRNNFTYAEGVEPLSWATRLKIATGAARGLAFLHTTEEQVIYRDFKSSNILLDMVRGGININYQLRIIPLRLFGSFILLLIFSLFTS